MDGKCLNFMSNQDLFFDMHYHSLKSFGIYNYNWKDEVLSSYFSVGIHPKDVKDNWGGKFEMLKILSQKENCLAIGECGLDALVETDEEEQEECFLRQILWANEIDKPIIIHCVRRFSQLLKFKKMAKVPMVIHGFNKKENIAEELSKKGFYLSFGKALLFNENLQKIAKNIPLDSVFLETDMADLEVENLYQKLAELKEISLEKLKKEIDYNIKKVFGI